MFASTVRGAGPKVGAASSPPGRTGWRIPELSEFCKTSVSKRPKLELCEGQGEKARCSTGSVKGLASGSGLSAHVVGKNFGPVSRGAARKVGLPEHVGVGQPVRGSTLCLPNSKGLKEPGS